MYRSTLHSDGDINSEYLKIFSSKIRVSKKKKWDNILKKHRCLSFLQGRTYDSILTASHATLVDIYYQYSTMQLSEKQRKKIDDAMKDCFPYKSQSSKIMSFIEAHLEHKRATTCPYCDYHEINIYHRDGMRRDYHLDHYLDKGKCPVLALSLHNLVPVCASCNTVKLERTFGSDEWTTKFLSPMNPSYDFDNSVHFVLTTKEDICKIKTEEFCKQIQVSLSYGDDTYKAETDITDIIRRIYNNEKTLSHGELVKLIYFVLAGFKQTYGTNDPMFASFVDLFLKVSTVEEREKGLRQSFDKFKRDISAYA